MTAGHPPDDPEEEDAEAHPPGPDQLGGSRSAADNRRVGDHESPAQPEQPRRTKRLSAFLEYLSPEPEHPPKRFPEPFEDLAARLATDDAELAAELLADAAALFAEPDERIESAERRATTLQGAVAIAAAVTVTGGGLLLDPDKIQGKCWRIAFAIGLCALVVTLVATAVRALGATTKRVTMKSPSHDDGVYHRATLTGARARAHRAAWLLHAYGVNNEVARVKVGYLQAAAWWFRWALVVLVAIAALLLAYVIDAA